MKSFWGCSISILIRFEINCTLYNLYEIVLFTEEYKSQYKVIDKLLIELFWMIIYNCFKSYLIFFFFKQLLNTVVFFNM